MQISRKECFGMMVADQGGGAVPVPISDVAGNLKLVPPDDAWVQSARRVGTCMGD